jgi:hypothetical protein
LASEAWAAGGARCLQRKRRRRLFSMATMRESEAFASVEGGLATSRGHCALVPARGWRRSDRRCEAGCMATVGQRRAPGVQDGGQADAHAQMLRVGGDRGQRLRGGPEQEVVDGRLVLERDGAVLVTDEGNMPKYANSSSRPVRKSRVTALTLRARGAPSTSSRGQFDNVTEPIGDMGPIQRMLNYHGTLVRKRNDRSTRSTICAAAWIVSGCCIKPGRGDIYPAISRATSS